MNIKDLLPYLSLLNLLLVPLGYLVHQLSQTIRDLSLRVLRIEQSAITKADVTFWQGTNQHPFSREK